MSLIISGIICVGMVRCGNINKVENTVIQEKQVQHPDIEEARELANQTIGSKYNSVIGNGFIERGDKIEFMFACDRFRMMNLIDNSGQFEDYEHLKREIIGDYKRIIRVYEMNGIDVGFIVSIKTYPNDTICFSIDESGNIYDILDDDFISNEDNWVNKD